MSPASNQEPGLFATLLTSNPPHMAADLITIIETAVVTQFLTPAAKNLGETVLERGKQMASKAAAYLAAVGRLPRPVEEKLLVPMLQGAGLESDPALAKLWAALLANAADPSQKAQVQPGFSNVLLQLTADDASVLTFIYAELKWNDGHTTKLLKVSEISLHFKWSESRMEFTLDNLIRLRLIDALVAAVYGPAPTIRDNTDLGSTAFGHQFLQAVTPPTP